MFSCCLCLRRKDSGTFNFHFGRDFSDTDSELNTPPYEPFKDYKTSPGWKTTTRTYSSRVNKSGPTPGKTTSSKSFTSGSTSTRKKQDPPIEHDLNVTLKEVLKGCVKRLKVTRKIYNSDDKTTQSEDKILTVKVEPGWKAGTRVTFEKEGSQFPGRIPADIVFIVRDKPNKLFTRCVNTPEDVEYNLDISLKEVNKLLIQLFSSSLAERKMKTKILIIY